MGRRKGCAPTPSAFKRGNRLGAKRGPHKVRSWSRILDEFFVLLRDDPAKLEELTGVSLPNNFKWRDGQLLLTLKEFIAALGGSLAASNEFKRWLHGDPQQNVNVKGPTFAQLVTEAHRKLATKDTNNDF